MNYFYRMLIFVSISMGMLEASELPIQLSQAEVISGVKRLIDRSVQKRMKKQELKLQKVVPPHVVSLLSEKDKLVILRALKAQHELGKELTHALISSIVKDIEKACLPEAPKPHLSSSLVESSFRPISTHSAFTSVCSSDGTTPSPVISDSE